MRRFLFLTLAVVFIILGVSGAIAAFGSKTPEPATPRADVYWAEVRLHMKIWNIEPAAGGTWKITYDIKLDGPRGVALTVPMDRAPVRARPDGVRPRQGRPDRGCAHHLVRGRSG
jgi:hypothetical protein